MRGRLAGALTAAALALAAGTPQGTTEPGEQAAVRAGTLPADAVVRFFLSACLANAPDFAASKAAFESAGLVQEGSGTFYHDNGTMSAKVQRDFISSGRPVRRCSVVYEVPDPDAVSAALQSSLRQAGGSGEFLRTTLQGSPVEGTRISVDGKVGVLAHNLYVSATDLGSIWVDFPAGG